MCVRCVGGDKGPKKSRWQSTGGMKLKGNIGRGMGRQDRGKGGEDRKWNMYEKLYRNILHAHLKIKKKMFEQRCLLGV